MIRLPCHDEPHVYDFKARVMREWEEKGETFILLDKSWFYPEGGGQPSDRGFLNDTFVKRVFLRGNDIIHVAGSSVGHGSVRGKIDGIRRYDFMQQHTGQHLLSAFLLKKWGWETIGFHLSDENVTIDIPLEIWEKEKEQLVEEEINRLIREHINVESFWIPSTDLSRYPVRKEGAMEKEIRLVRIGDADLSMCGGMHVENTAELNYFKVIKGEKIKKSSLRLYFLYGKRALEQARKSWQILEQIKKELSLPEDQCPGGVLRLKEEKANADKEKKRLEKTIVRLWADSLRESSDAVAAIVEDGDADFLCDVGKRLIEDGAKVCVLFQPMIGFLCLYSDGEITLKKKGQSLIKRFGGKGGGQETVFRINGCPRNTDPHEILRELTTR
ncbi:MAG TPA: alanyl-tRNA editing protein [Firmicutes bacterium]|nr:alanyl-tRNA editing protein [Bacillota bacterium]